MKKQSITVLGIEVSTLSLDEVISAAKSGGLFLAPSGPGLAEIDLDSAYMEALKNADFNLPDSGFLILLARILKLGSLPRVSGYGFLKYLLLEPELKKNNSSFWVMPSEESWNRNAAWLVTREMDLTCFSHYVAPMYPRQGPVSDYALLKQLEEKKSPYVFLCVGSGPQEKLGYWLRENLSYRPAIICIGAAIGFLTGDQVKIPKWADLLCLGWLLRCFSHPSRFVPRYLKAFRLFTLVVQYRHQSPPLHHS